MEEDFGVEDTEGAGGRAAKAAAEAVAVGGLETGGVATPGELAAWVARVAKAHWRRSRVPSLQSGAQGSFQEPLEMGGFPPIQRSS